MIGVTVKAPDLTRYIKLVPTPADMRFLASEAIVKIKARTKSGVDADGRAFVPYSADYAKYRNEKGRQDSPVDLTFHGRMMGNMASQTISNGAEVFFRDSQRGDIAARHNYGDGVPERRFFGLSESEFSNLVDRLVKRLRGKL